MLSQFIELYRKTLQLNYFIYDLGYRWSTQLDPKLNFSKWKRLYNPKNNNPGLRLGRVDQKLYEHNRIWDQCSNVEDIGHVQ